MATEQIGLEAVLQDANFQAGLKRYMSGLSDAEKKTSGAASGISSTLSGMGKGFVSLGNGVWDVAGRIGQGLAIVGAAAVATGVLIAKSALDSYASYERLGMALESLVAKELVNTSGTEKMVAAGQVMTTLTEAQRAKLADLRGELVILEGTHKAQESALNNSIIKGKESSEELAARRQKIIDLREKMDGLRGKIGELESQDGKLVTVMKKVTEGQLTMTDAMALAGPKAKDLLGWITKLAVESPFKQDDIANSLRLAMAYGFTTEEAKRLTQATVDYAAGSGASQEAMGRISLALGQIKARGKLSGQEIMQLTETGVSVLPILAKAFGMSTAEVQKLSEQGLIPADKAIEAITKSLEDDFGGAAKRQAGTFSGLLSSLSDLKDIGLREFFTGTFKAIQPYIDAFVTTLTNPETMGKISKFGEGIGKSVAGALDTIQKVIKGFKIGGFVGIAGILGATPEQIAKIREIETVIGKVFTFIKDNIPAIKGALAGIGTVLAGAGIAAALAAILNPVTLLIAAVGLLGAAWAADWGGIRTTLTEVWTNTLQPALAELWNWLAVNVPLAVGILADFWTNTLQPVFQKFVEFELNTVLPMWQNIFNWLSVNIPAAIKILSEFWTNTLQPAIAAVCGFIQANVFPLLQSLWNFLQVAIPAAIQTLANFWTTILIPVLQLVWSFISEVLMPMFGVLWDWLQVVIPAAIQVLTDFWQTILLPAVMAVWDFISKAVIPLFTDLANLLIVVVGKAIEGVTKLWNDNFLPAIKKMWDFIDKSLMPIFRDVAKVVVDVLGAAFEWARVHILMPFIDGLIFILGYIDDIRQAIRGLTSALSGVKLPGAGSGAPATPEYAEGGYVPQTGMALIHGGEFVLSKTMLKELSSILSSQATMAQSMVQSVGGGMSTVNNRTVNVTVNPTYEQYQSPGAIRYDIAAALVAAGV